MAYTEIKQIPQRDLTEATNTEQNIVKEHMEVFTYMCVKQNLQIHKCYIILIKIPDHQKYLLI